MATIDGTPGNDTLEGTAGADTINGLDGADTLNGLDGADTLNGLDGADTLNGGAGNDTLDGNDDDFIDTLAGGAGDDLYLVGDDGFGATDVVVEQPGEGLDEVDLGTQFGLDYTLPANVENGRSTGDSVSLRGNALNNALTGDPNKGIGSGMVLYGEGGNDVLDGGTLFGGEGNDTLRRGRTMYGGTGDDTYLIDGSGYVVSEAAGEGTDRVIVSIAQYHLTANVEVLEAAGGAAAIWLVGNALAQTITGNDGTNRLDGGGGADAMAGGNGDDVYYLASGLETVTEAASADRDVVYTPVNYTLAAGSHVEVLSASNLAGTTPLTLAGNELAQTIYGNAGANVIFGGGGADVLVGNAGDDTYYLTTGTERIVEGAGQGRDVVYTPVSATLAAGVQVEVLSVSNYAATTALTLVGNELAQAIYGNAGANVIRGGGGADVLVGNGGGDTYYLTSGSEQVIEGPAGGRDVVYTAVNHTLSPESQVEVLSASSFAATTALTLVGNDQEQAIYGNAGANTLISGGAADVLVGNGGDDSYYTDGLSTVIEAAGGGYDVIYASSGYELAAGSHVEVLSAASLSDMMPLSLFGNEFAQLIQGNEGNSVIDGLGGADVLAGAGGQDQFWFTTALGGGNVDFIFDFEVGGDKIALDKAIFTTLSHDGLPEGAFRAGPVALDADDRILHDQASGALFYDADGNGAGAAVHFADLPTSVALSFSDFLVV